MYYSDSIIATKICIGLISSWSFENYAIFFSVLTSFFFSVIYPAVQHLMCSLSLYVPTEQILCLLTQCSTSAYVCVFCQSFKKKTCVDFLRLYVDLYQSYSYDSFGVKTGPALRVTSWNQRDKDVEFNRGENDSGERPRAIMLPPFFFFFG